MKFTVSGFDWDDGNWPKCGKHGVAKADIEQVIAEARFIIDDPHATERRLRAVGRNASGRFVFVAFMIRDVDGVLLFRPISARYMHEKEVNAYEEAMAGFEE